MKRCDCGLERFQVARDLGLLDFRYVEQLPGEKCNRVILPFAPVCPLKVSLCLLQNKELLRLGSCVPDHADPVVTHSQLVPPARVDFEECLVEDTDCFRGAQV